MSATVAPEIESTDQPDAVQRGHAPFATPVVARLRGLRTLLAAVPMGIVPVTFLFGFVTVMTYVPSCGGEDITHRTPVTGVELIHGTVSDPATTPAPIQHAVAQAPSSAWAVLVIAIATLALSLLVRRFAPIIAAVGGGLLIVALFSLEGVLKSQTHRVDVSAGAGFAVSLLAGVLALTAGLCLVRWRRRELEPEARCAGFWRRVLAFWIDVLVLLIVFVPLSTVPGGDWLNLAILLLYWPLMEWSPMQATIGKQALGLVVTDASGEPITLGRAGGRHLARAFSFVTVIGILLAAWNSRRQALHDLMADTHVVRAVEPQLLDM
jgi:uncharacterized RDD family membrane protein YckC